MNIQAPVTPRRFVSTQKRTLLKAFSRIVEHWWVPVLMRACNGVLLVLAGVYFEKNLTLVYVTVFLAYVAIFSFFELLMSENSAEIHEEAREAAGREIAEAREAFTLRLRQTETSMETYHAAQQFLTSRFGKIADIVSALATVGQSQSDRFVDEQIRKTPTINEILRDLCESQKAIAAKSRAEQIPDAWFRATYMEVRRQPDGESQLEYIGWHTLDGAQPRSMVEGKKMDRGDKCAGIAWAKKRPVVEDFETEEEWDNNYPGQRDNYKSMICVPVSRGGRDFATDVIGVVTIDTGMKGYFGRKHDRAAEDRAGALVRPYASYIAFLTALNQAVTVMRERNTVPAIEDKST